MPAHRSAPGNARPIAFRDRPRLTTGAGMLASLQECASASLSGGRRIVLAGAEPGCGVSTVTALVTSLLDSVRLEPLVTVDASGRTTHVRLDVLLTSDPWPATTIHDVAAVTPPDDKGDIRRRLIPLAGRARLLPQSTAAPQTALDSATIHSALTAIEEFFELSVIDLGSMTQPAAAAILDRADAVGLVTAGGTADVIRIQSSLATQAAADPESWAARTTLIPNRCREGSQLRRSGLDCFWLRHDPGLQAPPISFSGLQAGTREATAGITAALISRASMPRRASRRVAEPAEGWSPPDPARSDHDSGWFINRGGS
ncbi:MinD-like ATPase involved in chromosome partitioning or flagellar assembly [Frankineae bacterium MT45]|nr:MinD-like ATPase involved in chromosome partitioning or flagellar assembly [Frankineae bacterium MT45]